MSTCYDIMSDVRRFDVLRTTSSLETFNVVDLVVVMKECLVAITKEKNDYINELQQTYESLLAEKESIIISLQSEIISLNSKLINETTDIKKEYSMQQSVSQYSTSMETEGKTEQINDNTTRESWENSVLSKELTLQFILDDIVDIKEKLIKKIRAQLSEVKLKLKQQNDIIQKQSHALEEIRNKLKHANLMLLEVKVYQLQNEISDKDTTIGFLEIQQHKTHDDIRRLELLTKDKMNLTKELKIKIQEKVVLTDNGDHKQNQFSLFLNFNRKHEVCQTIRVLQNGKMKLMRYVDHLLAHALNTDLLLVEGLPRLQQNVAMKPDLLRIASITELVDQLHEEEKDIQNLQSYIVLLLQRLSNYSY